MNHASGAGKESQTVFLSYASLDRDVARSVASGLGAAGIDVWWDESGIGWGDDWQGKLERALSGCGAYLILLGRGGVRRWVKPELGVALQRHVDEDLPIMPLLLEGTPPGSLPPFLSLFQSRSLPADLSGFDFSALAAELRAAASPTVVAVSDACPFPGLLPFEEEAADFFLGRQSDTLALLERLGRGVDGVQRRWLQVEGPSGVGKSSLVRAGLIPAVRAGWLEEGPAAPAWTIIVLRPGGQPLEALAAALERALATRQVPTTIFQRLEVLRRTSGEASDLRYLLRVAFPEDSRLLLVIDQLEELLTLTTDPEVLTRVDSLLASAVEDTDGPLYLVTSIRSDFLLRIGELPRLQGLLNAQAGRYDLQPLSLVGYREIVRIPAQRAGLGWSEASLPERIVEDAVSERAPLPLVANLLRLLWEASEKRGDRVLRIEDYRELNGVAGALAKGGDRLLASLGADGRERARRLLLALVKPGEESQDTKQPISRTMALQAAGGGAEAERVLNRLSGLRDKQGQVGNGADPRLVVVSEADSDRPGEQSYRVDLAHEALLRLDPAGWPYWKTLRDWIDGNREQLRRRELIRGRMRTWQEDGESPDRLLAPGRELEEGRALLSGAKDVPIGDIVPYVQRSIARAERRWRLTRLSIAAVFLALSAALIVTLQQWQRAEQQSAEADSERSRAEERAVEADRQADLAQAREIAIRAESVLDSSIGSTSLAGALAVESLRLADTIEGREVLASVMALTPRDAKPVETPWSHTTLRYSPTGDLLLQSTYRGFRTSPASGSVSVIDLVTLEPLSTHMLPGWAWPAISRDGKWMAISGHSRQLLVLDLEAGASRLELGYKAQIDARFSPDSQRLFVARADGVLETRTAPDWSLELEHRFADPSPNRDGVALSVPTVPGPLVVDTTAAAYLLPADGSPAQELHAQGGGSVRLAIIDPTGRRAFTSQWGRVETIWDAGSGAKIAGLDLGGELKAAKFSPDGVRLATAIKDGEIALWDATSGKRLASFAVGKSASSVDFSPDGALVAAGGDAGVTFWDLATSQEQEVLSQDTPIRLLAFDPDGGSVLITDDSNVLRRVDLTSGKELAQRSFPGKVISITGDNASSKLAVGVGNSNDEQSWQDMQAVDPSTGEVKWTLAHNGYFSSLVFNPDGRSFVTSTPGEDKLEIWSAETGELLQQLDTEGHAPRYSADGERLLVSSVSDGDEVLNADTLERLGTIGEPGGVENAAFVSTEGLLVTYGRDRTLRGWDIASGDERWRRTLPKEPVLSSDGRRYLVPKGAETWRIYDTSTEDQIAEIPSLSSPTARARFSDISPDSKRLLRITDLFPSTRTDKTPHQELELWDLENNAQLLSKRYDIVSVEGLFLPGGKVLVRDTARSFDVLDAETGVRLWGMPKAGSDKGSTIRLPPERAEDPLVIVGEDFTELRDQQTGVVLARYDQPLVGRILASAPSLMVSAEATKLGHLPRPLGDPSLTLMLLDWRTGEERWKTRLPIDIISKNGNAYIENLITLSDEKRLLVQIRGHRSELTILDLDKGDVVGTLKTDSDWKAIWPLPDPDLVLAWDYSSTVRVWRLSSGEEVRRFAHTNTARGVAVAKANARAVTYKGASLRVWDLDDLSQVAARHADGDVEKVAIRPDGRQVAYVTDRDRKSDSGATFAEVVLWDVDSTAAPRVIPIETVIGKLAYSRDGAWLAAGIGRRSTGVNQSVRVWDVETLRPMLTAESLPNGVVNEFSISADGNRLIMQESAGRSIGYRIWDIAAGREIARLDGSELLEVPDSTDVLVRDRSSWRRWDLLASGFESLPWSKSGWKLQVSPDGRKVTDTSSESFYSLDVETGSALSLHPIPPDEELKAHKVAANGDLVVFSQRKLEPFRPGAVSLRELPDGQELAHTQPDATITFLAFADGGNSLILGGNPGGWATYGESETLFLWRWRTGELNALNNDQPAEDIAFSPDGTRFVTAEGDWDSSTDPWTIAGTPQIREWDARTGKLLRSLQLDEPVGGVSFSPGGRYLAAQEGRKVQILRADDWEPLQEFQLQLGSNTPLIEFASDNLLVAADGRRMLERGQVPGIRLWALDGSTDRMLQTNKEHVPFVLSRDGQAIAARDDDILRVWDLESGAELTRHRFGDGFAFVFAGKDDQMLVQPRDRGEVLLKIPWRLKDVIEDACRRLERELDEEEQRRYLRQPSEGAGCSFRSTAEHASTSQ